MINPAVIGLNSSVQSQGLKLDVRDWLDMGSENWSKVPDEIKAAAYQAAKFSGWTDDGLKVLMLKEFGTRVEEQDVSFVLETLKELANKYPVEIEENNNAK